ncbi:MAG: hypothetical protein ACTSW1_09480 [Candidatus Hodarchaeales archaeon]
MSKVQIDEKPKYKFLEHLYLYLAKLVFFVLGFIFTMIVLILVYGSEATTKLFKGISIQNLILAVTEGNFSELSIMLYFIVIFLIFFALAKIIKKRDFASNEFRRDLSTGLVGSLREGSFTLPFFIMIAFPLMLQVVLPGLIILVAFFEILLMFMIVGEIWNVSRNHFIDTIQTIREKEKLTTKLKRLAGYIPITLMYPIFVYLLDDSGMDKFLSLLHYNILWNNPDSSIAGMYWGFVNSLLSLISFGNSAILQFLDSIKYLVNTFVVLIVVSEVYLFLRVFTKRELGRFIDHHVLIYD